MHNLRKPILYRTLFQNLAPNFYLFMQLKVFLRKKRFLTEVKAAVNDYFWRTLKITCDSMVVLGHYWMKCIELKEIM